MSYSSTYRDQDLLQEPLSHRRRLSYSHYDELSQDDMELPTASNSSANSDSHHLSKRRKLQKNTVIVFPVDPDTFPVDFDTDEIPTSTVVENSEIKASLVFEEKLEKALGDNRADFNNHNSDVTDLRELANSDITSLNVCDEDHSLKELCIAVLRSNGSLEEVFPGRNSGSNEVLGFDYFSTEFCKICGLSENLLDMLICDHCEDAFHQSCCYPRQKKDILSIDDWFCPSCSKLKRRSSSETYFNKSLCSSLRNGSAKHAMRPIEYMLKNPGQHISRVRIGEAFQAEVPEWSGQISEDVDCFGEPLELDPADTMSSVPCDKIPRRSSFSNWLQCRAPVCDDSGRYVKGTICGKWRRAPLSESQTDEWECFCSVLWDPLHSDCAVPQELETDEVLSQLKYIEQLKCRLATKKRG